MKRVTKTIFYTSCIILLATAYCFAFPVAGDKVKMSAGTNRPAYFPGGEFTLTTVSLNESYAAFCVEYNEYMNFTDTFQVQTVADYANSGGGGAIPVDGEMRDDLSIKTKWLMNEYVNGGLKSQYASHGSNLGGAMQLAVWMEEAENFGTKYGTYLPLAKELMDLAAYSVQGLDYSQFSNVKVVNLINEQGGLVQSQVIAGPAPVPEPATMLLLGTGLIGLAGFGRKKLKK